MVCTLYNKKTEATPHTNESKMYEIKKQMPKIFCCDGFSMSIQASQNHYCSPREDEGPYTAVEVGYPSEKEEKLMEYAENPSRPTDTVYGYVPVQLVNQIIDDHGGVDMGQTLNHSHKVGCL